MRIQFKIQNLKFKVYLKLLLHANSIGMKITKIGHLQERARLRNGNLIVELMEMVVERLIERFDINSTDSNDFEWQLLKSLENFAKIAFVEVLFIHLKLFFWCFFSWNEHSCAYRNAYRQSSYR